jgi:hypothetical protein
MGNAYSHINMHCDASDHNNFLDYFFYFGSDNIHSSQHMFDVHTLQHLFYGSILYFCATLFFDYKMSMMIAIFIMVAFELHENRLTSILSYNIAENTIDKNGYIKGNNGEYIIENHNGQQYKYMSNGPLRIVLKDDNKKNIKIETYKYLLDKNIYIYRGDSIFNIVGDLISGMIGAFIIYKLMKINDDQKQYAMLFLLFLLGIINAIIPYTVSANVDFLVGSV